MIKTIMTLPTGNSIIKYGGKYYLDTCSDIYLPLSKKEVASYFRRY